MPSRPRDNPFRVARLDAVTLRPHGWSWDELDAAFARTAGRGAIVAPHGHGKSRVLDAFGARLRARGLRTRWLFGREDAPLRFTALRTAVAGLGADEVVLVDGGGHVGALAWAWLARATRRCAGLVITAHEPMRLPTWIRPATSPELLRELVAELTDAAWVPTSADAAERHARHGGNLRAALRELFDEFGGR